MHPFFTSDGLLVEYVKSYVYLGITIKAPQFSMRGSRDKTRKIEFTYIFQNQSPSKAL